MSNVARWTLVLLSLLAVIAVGAAIVKLRGAGTASSPQVSEGREQAEPPGKDSSKSAGAVRLTAQQVSQFNIETRKAGPGRLRVEVTLPGEVALNADRVAHVVPRVPGVVREVNKNLGDKVRQGEVMAVLESRELGESAAALLAARERLNLSKSNFAREERLWLRKISSEQDYIQAKNALAESGIALRTAEQKLRALGFSEEYIAKLPSQEDRSSMLYQITAPFNGTITEKHISLGEVLKEESSAFVIADLNTVWVNLDVHQKDLPYIHTGQRAVIGMGGSVPDAVGHVDFLDPVATETNRTIHARVVVPNQDGRFRPGLFVNGRVLIDDLPVPVLVPNEALIMVEGKMIVFIAGPDGFRIQPVLIGRANGSLTEITQGLQAGQTYVTRGAYTLKSELEKPEAEK